LAENIDSIKAIYQRHVPKNQSRGYGLCSLICKHKGCEKRLCICQSMHIPNCVN
jgi:hypothetical protein